MADLAEKFSNELNEVRALRDELRVRIHLAGLEVRDAWEPLEKRLDGVEADLRSIKHASIS